MKRIIFATTALLAALTAQAGWDEQAVLARRVEASGFLLEKHAHLAQSTYTNGLFFDFDNDGLLDLLIVGQGGDWNFSGDVKVVELYRNLGPQADYRLERVLDTGLLAQKDEGFYNPVSAGDVNHDGYTDLLVMSYHNGRHVDLYLNDHGTGHFTRQEQLHFEGATNGSCMLGDLDGDGWLDVEYSGYADRTATCLKLYRNQHDGTFHDVSLSHVTGAFQGGSALADLDGDGRLDIISTGNGNNWVCLASVYMATNGGYTYRSESSTGLLGVSRGTPLAADLNADGRMDLVINGEPSNGSGFRTRIYYQRQDGTFLLDQSYPVVPVNQDGGINMADADGDGNMDLVAGGWIGTYAQQPSATYNSPLRVYENRPQAAGLPGNTRPQAPASVSASIDGDSITIVWTAGSDAESATEALRYNLFVRNDDTGQLHMLIPASTATGQLYVGTDLQTSLSSRTSSYTLRHFGTGHYTVGVQTLDQAYAPSAFTTIAVGESDAVTRATSPAAAPQYYSLSGTLMPAKPCHRGIYIEKQQLTTRKIAIP